jgi:hypothetical protein
VRGAKRWLELGLPSPHASCRRCVLLHSLSLLLLLEITKTVTLTHPSIRSVAITSKATLNGCRWYLVVRQVARLCVQGAIHLQAGLPPSSAHLVRGRERGRAETAGGEVWNKKQTNSCLS